MHELPNEWRKTIEAAALPYGRETLVRSGRVLSERYRQTSGEQRRLRTSQEAAAYAVARMPATYAAVHFALSEALRTSGAAPQSHLDCGSGTGAAALAAADLTAPNTLVCQDRESAMSRMAEVILKECGMSPTFLPGDILTCSLPEADLVTEGYMLGELSPENRQAVLRKLWDATQQLLLLVEPGTPEGFRIVRQAADALLAQGASIAAPCPGKSCPVSGQDWCHFSVRVPRSQLHKLIKGGDAPYEDEKFCYMAFTRKQPSELCSGRILRHPQIAPGKISLELCTPEGLKARQITKKDPLWKRARKCEWGDPFP